MTAPAPPAVALSLASVESYLRARGLAATYPDALVIRGVGDAVDLATAKANRAVMLTRGAGPGLAWEQTFDRPIVTVRCIGRQRDYDDAERFAFAVDRWLQAPSPVDVGGTRALYVVRTGGAPAHFFTDRARRAHFSCSYIIPIASGL
jgi:hypothetical protein